MTTACRQRDGDDLETILPGGPPGSTVDPDHPAEPGTPTDPAKPATPDNPGTQEEVETNYDATKKCDMANNPLVAETKKINYGVKPSFDLDTTGFVKNNVKIADLKGKTLTLITAIMYATFQYKNEKGEYEGEWAWFESLKSTYGLNLKYI